MELEYIYSGISDDRNSESTITAVDEPICSGEFNIMHDLSSIMDYSLMEGDDEADFYIEDESSMARDIESMLKVARWLASIPDNEEIHKENTDAFSDSDISEDESDSKPFLMDAPCSLQLTKTVDANKRKALINIFGRGKKSKTSCN